MLQIERDGIQRFQTYVHIYTTLKYLAIQAAPYMCDISKLRVKGTTEVFWGRVRICLLTVHTIFLHAVKGP
jgi:hypothetical protein